jgi:hypothetical protein
LGGRGCLDRLGATQNGAPLISNISRFGCLTQLYRRYIMLSSKVGRATLNTLVTGYDIVSGNFVLGEKKKKKRIGALLALSNSKNKLTFSAHEMLERAENESKTTAPRIPAWSPTVVLTRRHSG